MAAAKGSTPVEEMDYYELLGISKDATSSQIKKAFMKKARAWHPVSHREVLKERKAGHMSQCTSSRRFIAPVTSPSGTTS
jgi:preprotein translocase subunit Sec63